MTRTILWCFSERFGPPIAVVGLAFLIAASGPLTAAAQAPAAADSLARALLNEYDVPGLVMAFANRDGEEILSFGVAALDSSEPVGAGTRFEIGSVTKVFTGLLLAEMAQRGEVNMDDLLNAYVEAPTFGEQEIRLHQLSTHTSGLPRLPPFQIGWGNPRGCDTSPGKYEGEIWAHILYWIDNENHHRGQGYVYLRSLGIEPPFFWDKD